MDFIPLLWLIFGILLIGAEFLIPGFVIFFFGAGALIMALLTFLVAPLRTNYILQGIIWLVSSLGSLGFLRKFFGKTFRGKEIKDSREDEFIDKQAEVVEAISHNLEGRVKFEGSTWKAIAYNEDLKEGDHVQIIKKDNLTLIVTKME